MDELLIKYLLGEATPEEYARVRDWLAASPGNSRRFEQFRSVWEVSRGIVPAAPDSREAWKRMRQRVETGQWAEEKTRVQPGPLEDAGGWRIGVGRWRYWRVAAVLAGLLCVGSATWVVLNQRREPAIGLATETDTVQGDGNITILTGDLSRTDTLADGSVVTLHKNSHISYPRNMKEYGRTIRLEGEAFFSVTRDPSHPFIVLTSDIVVKALGTSFTIRMGTDNTEVIVMTGAVQVIRGSDSTILTAGKKFIARRKAVKTAGTETGKKTGTDTSKKKRDYDPQPDRVDHRQMMRSIIEDLVRGKIIADKDSLSFFGLDNNQFVVNGRTITDSLHALFRSKYIAPDGMGYFYGSPRDLKVYGRGYFYEKKDLY